MLCEVCVSLCASPAWTSEPGSHDGWKYRIVHQPSWSHLVAAAKAGCEVCALFERSLIQKVLSESIQNVEQDGFFPEQGARRWLEQDGKAGEPISIISTGPLIQGFGIQARLWLDIIVSIQHGEISNKIRFRSVYPTPDDPGCFRLARQWIDECVGTHGLTGCAPIHPPTFNPTRLLYLGETEWQCIMKVIEPGPSQVNTLPYVTLSHCWGIPSRPPLKLLHRNSQKFYNGIPLELLPRSFLDAVRVTKTLGYRYLWIDALCIVQDDAQDVARELRCMNMVYSLSVLTIAASDAFDSYQGFLTPRPSQYREVSVVLTTLEGHRRAVYLRPSKAFDTMDRDKDGLKAATIEKPKNWDRAYDFLDGVLSERAWALQERALPIRLLHYTKHQMVFECQGGVCSEVFPVLSKTRDYYNAHLVKNFLHQIAKLRISSLASPTEQITNSRELENVYADWYTLQSQYSARKLSFHRDRINAIEGLAGAFAKATGDRFLMGIWEGDFKRGLLWRPMKEEDYLSVRMSDRTPSKLKPSLEHTSPLEHGYLELMGCDDPEKVLIVAGETHGVDVPIEEDSQTAKRDLICHSENSSLTSEAFPSWTWASRTTAVDHGGFAKFSSFPGWVDSYIGSAQVDIYQVKDGKITIHGLCRYAEYCSKYSNTRWSTFADCKITFYEAVFDGGYIGHGFIYPDYIDHKFNNARTRPVKGVNFDDLLLIQLGQVENTGGRFQKTSVGLVLRRSRLFNQTSDELLFERYGIFRFHGKTTSLNHQGGYSSPHKPPSEDREFVEGWDWRYVTVV